MIKEKKEKMISVRISEQDYKYLFVVAYMAGMNVSKYVRTMVDASINAVKMQESKGAVNLEDYEKLLNDKLQQR